MTKKLLLLAILAVGLNAQAFSKPNRWTSSTSTSFPVVPVVSCPNTFASFFASATFPWANIRGQALTAANEIFVTGNSDVRLRLRSDLGAGDARCSTTLQPNAGEVLLVAESAFGGGPIARLGTTFASLSGTSITQAKVILHRGWVNNLGVYANHNWAPQAVYPAAGEFDFLNVLTHEFLHALGFNHSAFTTSIMTPSVAAGPAQRKLSKDDIDGFRDSASPYAAITTTVVHRWARLSTPTSWNTEPEPHAVASLGSPSVAYSNAFTSTDFYLMAFTRASDRAIMWGRTTGAGAFTPATMGSQFSLKPPSVAAGGGFEFVAFTENNEAASLRLWRNNTLGGSWTAVNAPSGSTSRVGPAISYLPGASRLVMVWADDLAGNINVSTSPDNGITWTTPTVFAGWRTFQQIGVTCNYAPADGCFVVFAEGTSPYTRVSVLNLDWNPGTNSFFSAYNVNLGLDAYGAGVEFSNTGRFQPAWRDRGSTSWMVTGGALYTATLPPLSDQTFLSLAGHSAPDMAFNASWSEYTLWTTYASRYDL